SGTVEILRQGTPLTLAVTTRKISDEASLDLVRAGRARPPSTFIIDPQGGGDFRTITGGLFQAIGGDTIILKPATYNEAVFITDGVIIRPEDQSTARIESNTPWLVQGTSKLQVHGLNFSSGG